MNSKISFSPLLLHFSDDLFARINYTAAVQVIRDAY